MEVGSPVAAALAEAEAAYERYLAGCADGGLDACPDDEVLDVWRAHECLRRRMAVGEFAIIHQVDRRGLAFKHACKSVRDFARHLLRIRPGEAKARVNAAGLLARRILNDGQVLEPIFPATGAAVRSGRSRLSMPG